MGILDFLFESERDRFASRMPAGRTNPYVGIPALGAVEQQLYGASLPRGVPMPRQLADRQPINRWARPDEALAALGGADDGILLGKLAGRLLVLDDDRPAVTVAMARSGKSSTVLTPNLLTYPGSVVVLDPKGELARETAVLRSMLGHRVLVADPFGQSGLPSASFNSLDEIDPASWTAVDDAKSVSQALVVDDADVKNKHWTDSARICVLGLILHALTLPAVDRNLVTVRQLLSLTHPALRAAVRSARRGSSFDAHEEFYIDNRVALDTLFAAMAAKRSVFDGVLAAIGERFLNTPPNERGSIVSTAAVSTDFLDSAPMRAICRHSDFSLQELRGDEPMTLYLCLPVGRMETHYRWLRMIIQQACIALERMGTYPRGRTPILFMLEEFATLGHMDIMERAAAYFPGFGVKLWAIIQNIGQLQRHYPKSWELFLGNAGVIQCFAPGDTPTLNYVTQRTARLIHPFEQERAFSRASGAQLLLVEGMPPIAAARLTHADVQRIKDRVMAEAWSQPLHLR